jgi:cytosine/adenosine deaminase-related metal-dependent hydrolase
MERARAGQAGTGPRWVGRCLAALLIVGSAACLAACREGRDTAGAASADILITGGTVITMDPQRRVIEDGAVAIAAGRIEAIGTSAEIEKRYNARRVIDARRKVVMPGLIDGHGHAGHGLLKSLGTDIPDAWYQACQRIYAEGSTEAFWRADALLTALERLKFGVTTGVTFFGGGDSIMRTDDPRYGDRHLEAVRQVGVRWVLAVGPRRGPYPNKYVRWDGDTPRELAVSFDDELATSETLIRRWHGQADGKISIAMMFPTHHPGAAPLPAAEQAALVAQARATRDLSKRYHLLFTQDGHKRGSVKFAHEVMDLLGPDALLSHSTDLTPEEIEICRLTDTRIVHNPSAIASMLGRCPATELIDAGVTVMLGSDGVGPDRSYDMFRHMFQAMRYHRFHFRDETVLPAGKVLEMVTIDAARALGMEKDLGSIEAGKKADVILLDMFKPHLYPLNMPVYRVAYFANGNDVDTVIVNGEVLMEQRRVRTVNEAEVLELAQLEADNAIRRTGLAHLLAIPDRFWNVTRGLK